MGFLAARDITAFATDLNQSLPDTCNIQVPTSTPNGQGGFSKTFSTTATVPCRVEPLRPKQGVERYSGGRVQSQVRWVVTVPNTATVDATYRLQITTQANRILQVAAVEAARSYQVCVRLICDEIT